MAWTKINTHSKTYDDPSVTYDDAAILYDSINNAAWINVATPNALDQENTTQDGYDDFGGTTTFGQYFAQTFKPSKTGYLKQFVLALLRHNNPTDSVAVSLYSDGITQPGTLLDTATPILGSSLPDEGQNTFFPVIFNFNRLLTANTPYWIVINRTGSLSDTDFYVLNVSSNNPYSRGSLFYYDGAWHNTTDHDAYFQEFYSDWSNVAKPSGGVLLKPGMYMGNLGLTYSIQRDVSPWTLIHKPE